MEFERNFFRLYERAIGSFGCKKVLIIMLITSGFLAILTTAGFLYCHIHFTFGNMIESEVREQLTMGLKNQTINQNVTWDEILPEDNLLCIMYTDTESEKKEIIFDFTKEKYDSDIAGLSSFWEESAIETFLFSKNSLLAQLSIDSMKQLKISAKVVVISLRQYLGSAILKILHTIFVDMGTLTANQLLLVFPQQSGLLVDASSRRMWIWDKRHFPTGGVGWRLFSTFWALMKSVLTFAILTGITAFVFRIGILASSVILIFCTKCSTWFAEGGLSLGIVYQAVPWLGIYGSQRVRRNQRDSSLLVAFFLLLVVTYMFYGISFTVWVLMFFWDSPETIYNEHYYYPYLELVEFGILIFGRTRITIKYFTRVLQENQK